MSNNYISVKQNNYLGNINKFFYRLSMLRHWPGSGKSGPQCSFSFWKTISFKQLVFLSQTCSGQMPYIYSCPQAWCLRLEKSPLSFPLPSHTLSIQPAKADLKLLICLMHTTTIWTQVFRMHPKYTCIVLLCSFSGDKLTPNQFWHSWKNENHNRRSI